MYLNDFLKVLMKYREFEFVLLSDVAESEYIRYFMEKGIPVITQGKAVYRSAGVYSYFSFIQKQLNEIQPDLFWEVNTIIPIRLKGNFKTRTIMPQKKKTPGTQGQPGGRKPYRNHRIWKPDRRGPRRSRGRTV